MTDTPRTDSEVNILEQTFGNCDYRACYEHVLRVARQLERELAAAKAELARRSAPVTDAEVAEVLGLMPEIVATLKATGVNVSLCADLENALLRRRQATKETTNEQ